MNNTDPQLIKSIPGNPADFEKLTGSPLFVTEIDKTLDPISDGCAEGTGLYSCPVSPDLDKLSKSVRYGKEEKYRIKMKDRLKEVPTEIMLEVLRERALAEPLDAEISVNKDNTVNFNIEKMTWPRGKFKAKIVFEKEIN